MNNQEPVSTKVLHTPIFLYSLSFSFVGFLLPIYGKALGASALEIGGLFSVFSVTTLFLRPLAGWMVDRFGRKPFLILALLLFAGSRCVYIFADSIFRLYLARFIAGTSMLFLSVALITMVADLSSPTERGKEMGAINQILARSGIIGVFFGFSLYLYLKPTKAWQFAFIGYAVMALISVWLAWRNVPETKPEVVQQASRDQIKTTLSVPLLKLMFIVFVTGTSGSMLAPIYLIYLQDKFTSDVGLLALAFLPGGLVTAFFASRLGGLSDRFGRISLMVIGMVAGGLLSTLIPILPSLVWLVVLFTLTNVTGSMVGPAQTAMVSDIVGQERRGRAYGLYDFALNLGVTIGPLLGGWLYDTLSKPSPFYLNGTILIICGGWVLLFMREHPEKITSL